MSNFLTRLRAAWLYWRYFPPTTIPPDYWTNADARALSNFLISDPGVKLRHMWVEKIHASADRAIMDQSTSKYSSGVAWGVRAMVAFNDSLLKTISPPTADVGPDVEETEGVFHSVNR
jgi:hypothetical protein